MTVQPPIFACERSAAKLLDLKPAEFRELVTEGHLPNGKEIAPGIKRWDVEYLLCVVRGDASMGIGEGIQW